MSVKTVLGERTNEQIGNVNQILTPIDAEGDPEVERHNERVVAVKN